MTKPSAKLSSLNIGDEVRIGGDRYTVRDQPEPPRVAVPPSTCRYGPMCHATLGGWMCHCAAPPPHFKAGDTVILGDDSYVVREMPSVDAPKTDFETAYRAARDYATNPDISNAPTPEQVNVLLSALLDSLTKPAPPVAPPVAAPVRAFPSAAINPAFGGMELRDWFAGQALAGLMSACDSAGTWQTVGAEVQSAVHAYAMADAMLARRSRG